MNGGDSVGSEPNEDITRLQGVLSRYSLSFAMVFGSAARSEMTDESDIDLAVAFENVRPEDDGYSDVYLALRSDLNAVLPTAVDLVDVHSMSPQFARTAFGTGIVIIGTEKRRDELKDELSGEPISVEDAHERVSAAVKRLRETQ